MEWALELINGYKRATRARRTSSRTRRNIVVPIVNAGRLRGLAHRGRDRRPERRPRRERRRHGLPRRRRGDGRRVPAQELPPARRLRGRQLHRRPSAWPRTASTPTATTAASGAARAPDTNPLTQTYRGPGPFSEPESRNIQGLVSRNQVMTLITNHTTAGLVLRAPGLAALGDPVDEDRGYKALGDAMAKENGYFSQKGFELYDTTGTTEDWSYNATGGFGFTFELYCGAPNYDDRRLRRPGLPPALPATMVKEWDGTNPTGRPRQRPGPEQGLRRQGQPRGVLHRRRVARSTSSATACSRAAVPPGPRCA